MRKPPPPRPRCSARTAAGKPCLAAPVVGGTRCFLHDPEHADAAAAARTLGGLRRRRTGLITHGFDLPDLRSLDGVYRLLNIAIEDALLLENGVARIRTLIYAASVAARLHEQHALLERLEVLERATDRAARPARPSWLAGSALDGPDLRDPDED